MSDRISSEIGSVIRELRKAAGMSQMRLADKIGVSYQQVQKYEKGASKLSVPRLLQFADVFGVPYTALFPVDVGGTTGHDVAASNLAEDEAAILMLYRRLERKPIKTAFHVILKDLVKLKEGKV